MEHIIKKLDRNLLTDWGFTYDGSYWIHKNYAFKLQLTKAKLTTGEEVDVYGLTAPEIGLVKPIIVNNNGILFQIIVQEFNNYIHKKLKDSKFLNNTAKLNSIKSAKEEYFSFDSDLDMVIQNTPVANQVQLSLVPNNEYTHTLLSGIECNFKIDLKSESELKSEILYYNPTCISYQFIKSKFPNYDIVGVFILDRDNNWEPFYGSGIPKIEDNHN